MNPNTPTQATDPTMANRAARKPKDYLGIAARGFAMGSADVVPGVSGGTMAFILGIYEELIFSIRAAGRPEFLRALFKLRLREALSLLNWPFLAALAAGIFLAIFTLARGLEWLYTNRPVLLFSFFFGLVLASVITVSRRVPKWTPALYLALAAGGAGAYLIVGAVPTQTPEAWWFLFLSGALAICAMILPGISGAFILLLLGKYQYVLAAVNNRDLLTLFWVAAGAGIGLITFAQFLGWLFKRHHDLTVAVLTGFMLGSLRKIWPWKETLESMTDRHGALIPLVQRNILPEAFNSEAIVALGLALLGVLVVLAIERLANNQR